jgi:hypothetical protein
VLVTDATSAIVLVVIIAVVGGLMWWGLRSRARMAREMKSPLYREGNTTERPPGSAVEIEEVADALGLKYFLGGGTRPLSGGATYPTVMYGERNGHEALIRQGLVGTATFPGLRLQKERHVTAVRVQAPSFEVNARDGRIDAPADAPGEVRGVVEALNPSPDVWHDLRVVGGEEGIVASRGYANDILGGWIYDLWFLERLASELGAPALPAVGVDEEWEIPYGMGEWAPKPWGG